MPDPISTASSAAKAVLAVSRLQPWRMVRRHDRLVLEEYEDLITWARDDLQQEAQQLTQVRERLAARGMLHSGGFGLELGQVRDEFSRRWRDRKRAADRKFAELREAEGAAVSLWRKVARKPWSTDPNAEELSMLSAAWEDETVRRQAVEREVADVQR